LTKPPFSWINHLIRPLQERRRDREAQVLGGLEVDEQLELGGLSGRSARLAPLAILSTYAGRIECGLDPVEQSKPENLACRRRPGGERRGEEAAS